MTADRDPREIHAFVDEELDLKTRLEIESSLETDPDLRAQVDGVRRLRQAVRERASYHAAPAGLATAIFGATASAPTAAESPRRELSRPNRWSSWFAWRPATATAFVAVLVASGAQYVLVQGRQEGALMDEVIASHVRSTLGDHLVDIASSDHHVVKPWLSSKLDFSPPIGDEMVGGATFVGGRLDYLGQRPVAALVYRAGGHVAEVFVWPDKGEDRKVAYLDDRGFRIAHWSRNGMAHWVVSDVSREAFVSFVKAVAAVEAPR